MGFHCPTLHGLRWWFTALASLCGAKPQHVQQTLSVLVWQKKYLLSLTMLKVVIWLRMQADQEE